MNEWKQFEIDCTDYLNSKYGEHATFEHQGEENANVADIEVTTNSGRKFYMEAKKCPAQCNQFVLLPDVPSRTFQYSKLNAIPINEYSQKIIDHMNSDFETFKEAGTSGKDIIFDWSEATFFNWVKEAYKNKGVEYFITNDYRIFKLEDISDNFNISAKYRVKRSGSTHVGNSRMEGVIAYINSHYPISSIRTDGKKLFVKSSRALHNVRFNYDIYEYMFSLRGDEYEIRQLSNTFNANVIFSVTIKNPGTDISEQFSDILI